MSMTASGKLALADVRGEDGASLQEIIAAMNAKLDELSAERDGVDAALAALIGEDAE